MTLKEAKEIETAALEALCKKEDELEQVLETIKEMQAKPIANLREAYGQAVKQRRALESAA